MKKGYFMSIAIALAFVVSIVSSTYAESSFNMEKDGKMYRCLEDSTIPLPKTIAQKKPYVGKQNVAKQLPSKVSKSEAKKEVKKDISKKEEVITQKEKKNTIFLEPMVYFMWSNSAQKLVTAPGLGISYVRELTPTFSLGGGISYAHAFYGAFPDRTFNMAGAKIMFGFKF